MSARRAIAIYPLEAGPVSVELHPNDRTMLVTYETRLEVRLTATGEKVWGARFEDGLAGAVFAEEGRSVIAAAAPEKWTQRASSIPSAERDLVRVSEDEARRSLDVRVSSVLGAAPDGTFALLHYGDGELGLFDLHELVARLPFVMAERAALWTLRSGSLSRNAQLGVTSTRKGVPDPPVSRLEVWHPAGGSGRGRSGNASGEAPVAASPNGKFVLYGSGRNAVLWNVPKGSIESPMSVDALAHDVSCVEFESDGRRFLYGGGDRVEVVKRLPGKPAASLLHEPFAGAPASVVCARFSHDGRRVVTAAADGRVFLWGVA